MKHKFWGLLGTLLISLPAYAADISGNLLQETLAIVPRITALAAEGREIFAASLKVGLAKESVNIGIFGDDIYYLSAISIPDAVETRFVASNSAAHRGYAWSAVLIQEYKVKSLLGGNAQLLFKTLDSALAKQYPSARHVSTPPSTAGSLLPVRLASTLTTPGKFTVGLEVWFDKERGRNTLRLWVSPG